MRDKQEGVDRKECLGAGREVEEALGCREREKVQGVTLTLCILDYEAVISYNEAFGDVEKNGHGRDHEEGEVKLCSPDGGGGGPSLHTGRVIEREGTAARASCVDTEGTGGEGCHWREAQSNQARPLAEASNEAPQPQPQYLQIDVARFKFAAGGKHFWGNETGQR